MKKSLAFLDGVERSLKWVCMGLVVGLTVLVFASVLCRYLLNAPIEWSDEVVGFFILALTYFGSAAACSRRSQIYVELLESTLKTHPAALRWVRLSVDLVVMLALAAMVAVGLQLCVDCQSQRTGILVLSYFYVYLIMPLGVTFMVLMIIRKLILDRRTPDPANAQAGS